MSAAFDTVSHEVLLGKLKLYGVSDQALGRFAAYFSNRAQQCEIGGARSSIIKILHGVFQGSILGPLLFICFMNDVVVLGTLTVLFILYADDTTIVVKLTGNLVNDQALDDQKMEEISTYMNANSLAFNFKKTNLINVSVRKREDPGIVLNLYNEVIQPVDAARLLGVQITKDLTQNYYINDMEGENLMSQVEQRFRAFGLLSTMTSVAKLKQLGYGIIVSKLAFGVTFWADAPDYLLNKVDVFLNKVVRTIFNLPDRTSNKTMKKYYMDLSWMQIRELRSYHDILTLESIMSSHQPWSFASQLQNEFARITAEQGQIRMTQETSPNYGPRREAFFSRACRLYKLTTCI